jgi:hypothetical protein
MTIYRAILVYISSGRGVMYSKVHQPDLLMVFRITFGNPALYQGFDVR